MCLTLRYQSTPPRGSFLKKEDLKKVHWAHKRLKLSLLSRETHRLWLSNIHQKSVHIDFDVEKDAAPGDISKTVTHVLRVEKQQTRSGSTRLEACSTPLSNTTQQPKHRLLSYVLQCAQVQLCAHECTFTVQCRQA